MVYQFVNKHEVHFACVQLASINVAADRVAVFTIRLLQKLYDLK